MSKLQEFVELDIHQRMSNIVSPIQQELLEKYPQECTLAKEGWHYDEDLFDDVHVYLEEKLGIHDAEWLASVVISNDHLVLADERGRFYGLLDSEGTVQQILGEPISAEQIIQAVRQMPGYISPCMRAQMYHEECIIKQYQEIMARRNKCVSQP